MATRTLTEGFNDFHLKLTPSLKETEAAKLHRASIKKCLEDNFGMTNFFRTGSFGNGTSISGYSDVDYFAVIPTNNLKKESSKSLIEIKDKLNTRFQSTNVRVNCPAVNLPFGTDAKETTEVVPSYIVDDRHNFTIYGIPDCNNGWMYASPDAHNNYVREQDNNLNKNLKKLIRFVKAWKFYCNVPILSFYIELRITKLSEDWGYIEFVEDLYNCFKKLSACDLAQMQDPMGVSGYISPCKTDIQLEDAKSKLATALIRAKKAYNYSKEDDVKNTFEWLNKLFNGNFPSYYK